MPPRDRGFTIAFIPHSAHGKRREFRVPGGAAPFFRLGVVFLLIILAAAAYVSWTGASSRVRIRSLDRRVAELQDSLAVAVDLDWRLNLIEARLEEIRATRRVIENLASQGASTEE